MPFGLKEKSCSLCGSIIVCIVRVMISVMTRGLGISQPEDGRIFLGGFPGAYGPLHCLVVVYMDNVPCYSPSLKQHLNDVREVFDIVSQEKIYIMASKREFRRRKLGFLGRRVSAAGVAVDCHGCGSAGLACLNLQRRLAPVHQAVQ